MSDLDDFRSRLRSFVEARDWAQFHDPKSVMLALVGEIGELAELLQWLPADEAASRAQSEPLRTRVGEEVADVFTYLLLLADSLGVDILQAAHAKLTNSESRFESSANRGTAPSKA